MTALADLQARARTARQTVERRKGELATLQARRNELEAALAASRDQAQTITRAAILLREAGDYARERARQQVEVLTSSAMQSVFGTGYRFGLESGELGGRPTITCRVITPYGDGDELTTEGSESRGGGVVDIQALALRWAMLETYRPQIEGPLLLDEPMKHVSEENVPAAGAFLRQACLQFGRQVIMVTHNPHLAALADRVYRVELKDGQSEAKAG